MEIGSEFWLFDLPKKHLDGSPFWIRSWGNNILTSSGRGALTLLLEKIEERILCNTALLPSYICSSIVAPFIENGYTCYYYDINQELYSQKESVDFFLKEPVGVFLHMGYYGFPTNESLGEQIKQFKYNGTIIIEDITHTLFSQYSRFKENDYYIASLRKWTGLPSGGFLAAKYNNIQDTLSVQSHFYNIRKKALLLKGQFIKSNIQELKQIYLDMFKEGEHILDSDLKPYLIDITSNTIIQELDVCSLIKKRRQNFLSLLEFTKKIDGIECIFDKLPNNICPFFFPIYVQKGRKDKLRKKLSKENIYCPVHWPIPEQINLDQSYSKMIYDNIMSLPCDQRYGIEEMYKMVDFIRRFRL